MAHLPKYISYLTIVGIYGTIPTDCSRYIYCSFDKLFTAPQTLKQESTISGGFFEILDQKLILSGPVKRFMNNCTVSCTNYLFPAGNPGPGWSRGTQPYVLPADISLITHWGTP